MEQLLNKRAKIAVGRCRDLKNVKVFCATNHKLLFANFYLHLLRTSRSGRLLVP